MMKASLILLYFAIVLLCSCSQPVSQGPIRQPETSGTMLPLHTGNTWTYVEAGSGRHDIPADPYVITSVPDIVYSYPTAPGSGRQCFESETFTDGTHAWIVSYNTIMIGVLDGTESYITSFVPTHPQANTRYGFARELLCVGSEQVSTPAGSFTCYHFKLDGGADYWWATGIGLVQKLVPAASDQPAQRWMLESFHLAAT
ncbi:MAG TPA: hypothetical protein VHI13_04985 [Candidatus Kapabacteria bacterium]|nr:hypothetical protein [Candidatus Kapabacteria bacterium]